MATEATDLIPVATRIEPDLRRRLEEKRKLADRSEAAEIRQAIRAWVEPDEAEPASDSRVAAA